MKVDLDHVLGQISVIDGMYWSHDFEDDTWWQSQDGVTWAAADEPFPYWPLISEQAGGATWAVDSPNSYSVMMGPGSYRQVIARFYCDGGGTPALLTNESGEWEEVPLPTTSRGSVERLRIQGPLLGAIVDLGGSNWLLPVSYMVTVPWGDLYGRTPPTEEVEEVLGSCDQGDPWPMWNSETRQLEIRESGSYPSKPSTRLNVSVREGVPPVIEFVDDSTGALVEEIPATYPGWTAEELMKGLRGWGFEDQLFVVSSDGVPSVTTPPWAKNEVWMGSMVTLHEAAYTMSYVVADDYSATDVNLWRTDDGLDWEQIDLPALSAGPIERADLAQGDGQLLMKVQEMGGGGSLWHSTDGVGWDRVATPIAPGHEVMWTDLGWVLHDGFGPDAFSADGRVWESLDMPPLEEASLRYENDRLFLGPMGAGDTYTMWVGTPTGLTNASQGLNATACRPRCWPARDKSQLIRIDPAHADRDRAIHDSTGQGSEAASFQRPVVWDDKKWVFEQARLVSRHLTSLVPQPRHKTKNRA
jgi:hypothetical protein